MVLHHIGGLPTSEISFLGGRGRHRVPDAAERGRHLVPDAAGCVPDAVRRGRHRVHLSLVSRDRINLDVTIRIPDVVSRRNQMRKFGRVQDRAEPSAQTLQHTLLSVARADWMLLQGLCTGSTSA